MRAWELNNRLSESHIRNVLGISIPLTESYYTPNNYKTVLKEQLMYEGFLDSIKTFVKDKYDTAVDDIAGTINDAKKAAILIKDVIVNEDLMGKVVVQLKKQVRLAMTPVTKILDSIENALNDMASDVAQRALVLLSKFRNFVSSFVKKFFGLTGWKGFLALLGISGFIKFIGMKVDSLKDMAIDKIQDFLLGDGMANDIMNSVSDFGELISGIAGAGVKKYLDFFERLKTVRELFFKTLSYLKSKFDFSDSITASATGVGL